MRMRTASCRAGTGVSQYVTLTESVVWCGWLCSVRLFSPAAAVHALRLATIRSTLTRSCKHNALKKEKLLKNYRIMMKLWSVALLGAMVLSIGNALECYVCKNQEGNIEKCLNTIKTCEQGEDTCLSEIKWGSTPYWNQGAKKQFYISKRCSTKLECEKIRRANMPDCSHIWYQDWKCSECCQGDRCNYYIISGANNIGAAVMSWLLPIFAYWRMQ